MRYLLADPEPGASATDVLGQLVACDADVLEVETESGRRVRVPAERVVAARPVPPRPSPRRPTERGAPRIAADALQRVCGEGWPARTVQPLGDWLLREAAGFTGRANSVLPVGDPGRPLTQALAAVEAFYAAHHLPALALTVIGRPAERQLLDAGWEVTRDPEPVLVQVASVASAQRSGRTTPGHSRGPAVDLLDAPTDDWMAVYGRAAGAPADVVAGVLGGPPVTAFAAVGAGRAGGPVAIGRGVVSGDWLGLSAVEVVPSRRREGLARGVVEALLAWGAERGARSAYLQTLPGNAPALALYAPYGFVTHHRYRFLAPAPDARSRREPGRDPSR